MQRYATDWAREQEKPLFEAKPSNGKTVAIIGSGPAGLSAARDLARLGYEVTIFEAEKEAGGLNYFGIVSFRLPKDVVEWEVQQVEQLGVEIKTNTRVGVDVSVDEIKNNYDRVVLAIGMGDVPNLGIEGEELEGVYDAIQFVKNTKLGSITESFRGKKLLSLVQEIQRLMLQHAQFV